MRYPHIAARVFNTPLLIAPKKLDAIMAFLGPRIGIEPGVAPARLWFDEPDDDRPPPAPYTVTERGTAVICVHGALVHRGSTIEEASGLTSYTVLSSKFCQALGDPDVRQIVFDLDSPGGEAAGAFDFADEIYAARGLKPMTAIVNEMACSAGYLIASAADRVIATRTGYTGSIGVLTSRLDISKANERAGVAVTMIYAGDRKIDGYPYEPMTGDEKDALQRDVERLYDLFVTTVARNRNLTADQVRATEASVYDGEDALSRGLITGIQSYKQALAGIEASLPAIQVSEAAQGPRVVRAHRTQRAARFKRR